jgi:Uma2 family endonuclease
MVRARRREAPRFWYDPPVTTQTRLSLEEFLTLPEIDERRLELIDGEVYEKVSPRWGHGRIAIQIGALLDAVGFASVEPRALIEGGADRGPSSPLPDIAFYRNNPPGDGDWMTRPPAVAVEILSLGQSRAAMRAKVDLYLTFGVESVWVVDLEREAVDIYESGIRRTLSGDEAIESPAAPGFHVTVSKLFERK